MATPSSVTVDSTPMVAQAPFRRWVFRLTASDSRQAAVDKRYPLANPHDSQRRPQEQVLDDLALSQKDWLRVG